MNKKNVFKAKIWEEQRWYRDALLLHFGYLLFLLQSIPTRNYSDNNIAPNFRNWPVHKKVKHIISNIYITLARFKNSVKQMRI